MYGLKLPFENLQEMRIYVLDAIKENTRSLSRASGLLTKGFFQILVGVFSGALCFLSDPVENREATVFDAVRREFDAWFIVFIKFFEMILGAQFLISLINTVLTAVFIMATAMPYITFLTLATFIFGVIPIIGNILSNTIIVATAMTVSPRMGLLAFGFLILIHKGEYFLNSKIVGSRINIPMWQTLIGLLVGEIAMGVPGMILAPVFLYYVREEMQAIPLKPGSYNKAEG
jgi:predicted PurR-regulated permease PerM